MVGGLAWSAASALPPTPQTQVVPGFADFLAVDGDTVWVTNVGRVERWSTHGKLASVAMAHPCGAMALTADALWVADCQDRTLTRIDRISAQKVAVVATGVANPAGELNVVAGAGSIWLTSDPAGVIVRVDAASNRIVATIRVDPGSDYLAFGFDALWAVSGSARTVQKIDPATDRVTARTTLGRAPGFLVAGEGAVWVQEQDDGTVARIDPASAAVTGRIKVDATLKYGDIDAGGGRVWLRTTAGQTLVVIDPTTLAIRARLGPAAGSGALRYTPTGLWTTAHDQHGLSWWPDGGAIANQTGQR